MCDDFKHQHNVNIKVKRMLHVKMKSASISHWIVEFKFESEKKRKPAYPEI